MLDAIDWKFRFWFQEALNFLGKKLGITRAPIIINSVIIYSLATVWVTIRHSPGPLNVAIAAFAIFFNVFVGWVLVRNCSKQHGEEKNWQFGKFLRRWYLIWLPCEAAIVALGLVLIGLSSLDLVGLSSLFAIITALWISTCIEAPPKEARKKLSGKLALSTVK